MWLNLVLELLGLLLGWILEETNPRDRAWRHRVGWLLRMESRPRLDIYRMHAVSRKCHLGKSPADQNARGAIGRLVILTSLGMLRQLEVPKEGSDPTRRP